MKMSSCNKSQNIYIDLVRDILGFGMRGKQKNIWDYGKISEKANFNRNKNLKMHH